MTVEVVNAYLDGDALVLLQREGDRLVETRQRPEYSFFVRTSDLPGDLVRQLQSSPAVRAMSEEGSWTRIVWKDKWARLNMLRGRRSDGGFIQSPFQSRGIPTFEGDVDPVRRFFTDSGARVARPRRGYFDLETDSRTKFREKTKARVLSWAIGDEDGKIWSGVLSHWSDEAERDLLLRFYEVAAQFDQLLAWGGDRFDFVVLNGERPRGSRTFEPGRIGRLGLKVDPRRWHYLDHLALFKRMNTASESGDEKQSLKLNAVAYSLLGEGKDEFDSSKTREAWEAGGDERARLLRYNEQDTRLLPKIEAKTGSAALFDVLCDVCRVLPGSRGLKPTQQMDGFMLRLALEQDHHFATREYDHDGGDDEEDQFKGAFVLHPRTVAGDDWTEEQARAWRDSVGMTNGIARNVHVADFASLYPSIIRTWNMSPDTKTESAVERAAAGLSIVGIARSPTTGICFETNRIGILPAALGTMIALRKEWNDKKKNCAPGTKEFNEADRRSTAYKVAANSFYGVLGNQYSRFYDREIAESVTQNGVWLIKRTIEEAEKRGMRIVYGDTDSFFAVNASQTEFEAFVKWCNADLYPRILAEVGVNLAHNKIELAYEKAFDRVVFVTAKRYAGRYLHYKGKKAEKDSKPEVRGLEYRRGDSSLLARRLQESAILELMNGSENVSPFRMLIDGALAHVTKDDLPLEEIVQSKSLSKAADEYEAPIPAHARIALEANARGFSFNEGDRVPYIITDASDGLVGIVAEEFKGEFDRYYLWEKLVYPPTMRLMQAAFPDQDWETGLEKIRPPKLRSKGKQAPIEQGSLFAVKRDPVTEAQRLIVPERLFGRNIEPLVAPLRAAPGPVPVTIVIQLVSGAEAVISTGLKTTREQAEIARAFVRHHVEESEAERWRA